MTAFRATYSDLKLIKTRKVVQIIFEIPQEDFDAAYEVLGGLPNPAAESWFGIAPLKEVMSDRESTSAERPRPDKTGGAKRMEWRDVQPTAQANIRSNDPRFWAFLREVKTYPEVENENTAAIAIRHICQILSRSELSSDHRKRVIWHQLDEQFQAWKQVEHA